MSYHACALLASRKRWRRRPTLNVAASCVYRSKPRSKRSAFELAQTMHAGGMRSWVERTGYPATLLPESR